MALASIRNERDLIVISAIATESTAASFAATASAGEGRILSHFGADPVGKTKFAIYVKHLDGRMRKSDVIDPDKLISYKIQAPISPVLPSSLVTIVTATVGDLYEIHIRVFNDGSLSNDNTVLLNAYYQAITGDTPTTIANGLVASYNAAQTRMGQSYFTCTNTGAAITFQSTALPFVTGKKDGRQLVYKLKATQVNPTSGLITETITNVKTEGVLDPAGLNYLKDLEWQTRGAFGDSYRGLMYPFDFPLQSDISDSLTYTLYEFVYYDGDENNHAVQKSPRHLTVAVPTGANTTTWTAQIAECRQVINLAVGATDNQVLTYTTAALDYHPA